MQFLHATMYWFDGESFQVDNRSPEAHTQLANQPFPALTLKQNFSTVHRLSLPELHEHFRVCAVPPNTHDVAAKTIKYRKSISMVALSVNLYKICLTCRHLQPKHNAIQSIRPQQLQLQNNNRRQIFSGPFAINLEVTELNYTCIFYFYKYIKYQDGLMSTIKSKISH